MTIVLGLSCYYHDSAAALVIDGRIVAAAQEERFSRIRHDAAFPARAIGFCLAEAGLTLAQVDHIVFYEKPFLKFERLLETHVAIAPRGFLNFLRIMPVWLKGKLFQKRLLARELAGFSKGDSEPLTRQQAESRLLFGEHHLSHAASAFYPSPFERAAILTVDGAGEWCTTSIALGEGAKITPLAEIHFPHSLGLLYSALTLYCGFRVNSGEYKLMGLAPFGTPRFADLIRDHLIDLRDDGSFRLDMAYFGYLDGRTMITPKLEALFGAPARASDGPLTRHHADVAASAQLVCEEVVAALARRAHDLTGADALCLAGGVALNCVANGKLLREGPFSRLWIQPAAGDAGGALGAALAASHLHADVARIPDPAGGDAMNGARLGPAFTDEVIRQVLDETGAVYRTPGEAALLEETAQLLAGGKVIGWFRGRAEFGPRALGGRSILADPRAPGMQETVNLRIKFREGFRPFAPVVRAEDAVRLFDLETESPYMLLTVPVREADLAYEPQADFPTEVRARLARRRSAISAVTHVDGSARVQTVRAGADPALHGLLSAFARLTGCPVLINTSFNIRGEPIVNSPAEALRCFFGTGLDALVVGGFLLEKAAQPARLLQDYRDAVAPD